MNRLERPLPRGFMRPNPKLLCWLLANLLAFAALAQQTKSPGHAGRAAATAGRSHRPGQIRRRPVGGEIVSLDTGVTVFEQNPQKLFSPASNSKLYTVALALDRLGADYRIKTSLYAKAKPNASGTLKGDLIVYGRGDPTINARLHGGDIYQALEPLVRALTNAGVKRITGDLVGDDSFFHGPPFGSGWAWDDLEYYYGAEVSALTINDNTLQAMVKPGARVGAPCQLTLAPATAWLTFSNRTETVEKGAARRIHFYHPLCQNVIYVSGQMPIGDAGNTNEVTVHNPAGLFASFFKEALARQGIKVSGKVRSMNWLDRQAQPLDCDSLVELGSVESLPLRDIAREVREAFAESLHRPAPGARRREVPAAGCARRRDFGRPRDSRAEQVPGRSRHPAGRDDLRGGLGPFAGQPDHAQRDGDAAPVHEPAQVRPGVSGRAADCGGGWHVEEPDERHAGCRQRARQDRDPALGQYHFRLCHHGGGRAPGLLPDGQPLLRSPPRARRPGHGGGAAGGFTGVPERARARSEPSQPGIRVRVLVDGLESARRTILDYVRGRRRDDW